MHRFQVWSAGVARRALQPNVRTGNPTLAAAAMLGKGKVARATRVLKRKGRKRAHRGNPLPAVVGVLGGLSSLAGRFKSRAAHEAERAAYYDRQAVAALAGSAAALEDLRQHSLGKAPSEGSKQYAAARYEEVLSHLKQAKASAAAPAPAAAGGLQELLSSPVGAVIGKQIVSQAFKRPRRPRYPSYMDRYGRQRYSYKPPGSPMRLPVGAQAAVGSPYSFFSGAVGKGGAGTTAGQLAVAGAAGVGAYLATQALLKYLGGRAQSKEEAGTSIALANGEAIREYKRIHGVNPPANVRAEMKAAMQQKLVELGYDPVTFTRTRTGLEDFLETYNPFGG